MNMSDFPPHVMGGYLTNQAIIQTTTALLDRDYIIRLVHRDGYSPEHPTIPRTYTVGDLRKPGTTKYLRHMNRGGYHVYFRPKHLGYVRIDDLCEDAIDQMRADGINPCAVIETSKGLFHAWIRLVRSRSTDTSSAENRAAARLLSKRYGGDMGATGSNQIGRLPGFRNVKECYEDSRGGHPLVMLRSKSGTCAPEWLLEEVRTTAVEDWRDDRPISMQNDLEGYAICADEGAAIYHEAVQDLVSRFPDMEGGDRSRLDFSVARWLAIRGLSIPEAVAVLMSGSAKARDRGCNYVFRTVERAFDF